MQWMLTHLPLTAAVAGMGAAVIGLAEHAHYSRTPAATAWVLSGGAAVVLCATTVLAASLRVRSLERGLAPVLLLRRGRVVSYGLFRTGCRTNLLICGCSGSVRSTACSGDDAAHATPSRARNACPTSSSSRSCRRALRSTRPA
ncbi:hypothetical protein [Streptomyces sp. NPDC003710]